MPVEATADDSARPIAWVVPACLFAAALIFLLIYLLSGSEGDAQSAAALVMTAAPFSIAAQEDPRRLLHPLALFGLTMLLGVAGQTILLTQSHPAVLHELLSGMSPRILTRGLTVVGIGTLFLCVGYLLSQPARGSQEPGSVFRWAMSRRLGDPVEHRVFWICLALLGIATVVFAVYAPKVGIHNLGELLTSKKRFVREPNGRAQVFAYFRFFIELPGVGFIAVVYTITKRRLSWRSALGAVGIVSFLFFSGFAIIVSSRTELFATLATVAFVYIALRGRDPRFRVALGMAVVAILLSALLLVLRSAEREASTAPTPATGTGTGPAKGAAKRSKPGTLEKVLNDSVGSRDWMSIAPIAVVTERVPGAYPFQYGKTLISLFAEPIPKAIWPQRPSVNLGQSLAHPVYGFPEKRISGDPPGIVGELWVNGGIIGVILGMLVLGVIIKWIERWYSLAPVTNGLSAIAYGVAIVAFCLQMPIADFSTVILALIETLVSLLAILWIARRPAGRLREPEPQAGRAGSVTLA